MDVYKSKALLLCSIIIEYILHTTFMPSMRKIIPGAWRPGIRDTADLEHISHFQDQDSIYLGATILDISVTQENFSLLQDQSSLLKKAWPTLNTTS